MNFKMIILTILLIEISGMLQYTFSSENYKYPYLTIIFVGLMILNYIYKHFSIKSQTPISKTDKLISLGKKVKSGILVDTDDCPICMDKMCKISNLSITNCNHVFHNCCLNNWRAINNYCPMCRTHINMERELPKNKSASNIFTYHYYKNSLENLKDSINEIFDDDKIPIYNFGDDKTYLLDRNDNLTSI